MIFFTADLHLNHIRSIFHGNRPFANVEEMNETIIERINSKVKSNHSLYILGDVFWGRGAEANVALRRLNGKKYLIRGNHDKFLDDKDFDQSIFEWVKDLHKVKHAKKIFVLCHYPILEWPGYYRGYFHCYGHVHSSYLKDDEKYNGQARLAVLGNNAINVGVDANNFMPVSADEIIERISAAADDNSSS